jgi:CRP-like cAMP-binding protein
MITSEREQFLQHLALFSDLEASELRALADAAQVVQFPASALIFREGEVGDCAYVVVRGSVQVFATDRNGDEVVLAQLKELNLFGEQSLLPGRSERRNASLRACEDTTLLRIPKAEFQKVLTQRHTLKDLLSQTGQQQVRTNMIRTARLARKWALFMFINGFISIGILCGLAMVFRTPFIFPSLGAFALSEDERRGRELDDLGDLGKRAEFAGLEIAEQSQTLEESLAFWRNHGSFRVTGSLKGSPTIEGGRVRTRAKY